MRYLYRVTKLVLLTAVTSVPVFADEPNPGFDSPQSDHWAFQALDPGVLPSVKDTTWPRTAIDRYVLAQMDAAGQAPNPEATRRALIRRVTFALIGLPPSPEAVDAFVADTRPQSYARLVERLLASPQYGERWGRHWLDVVRYADSNDMRAIGARHDITETYRYRDWVVRALNADLPYNRFMMDQLAGDLFPVPDKDTVNRDGIIATGMLAFGSWGPGDSDGEKMHTDMVDDMINVTTRAFLGLTVACARCHDHKFDPITQADYYALAGIFFSTEIAPPGTSAPWVEIPLVSQKVIEQYNHSENVRKESLTEKEKQLADFRDRTYQSLLTTYVPETSRYLDASFRYLTRPAEMETLNTDEFASRQVTDRSPQPGRILLMVQNPDQPRAGDLGLANHLRGRGHEVTFFAPARTTGPEQFAAAMQHDVVLISESIAAAAVVFAGDRSLKTVPRPIISYEPYMYHSAGWTGRRTHVDYGLTGVGTVADLGLDQLQDSLFVHASDHAMTLGLSGRVRVYDQGYTLGWGKTSPAARVIASVDAEGKYPTMFIYEPRARLADGTAAVANRIGIFLGQQAIGNPMASNSLDWDNVTVAGAALIDAAIEYSINPDRVSHPNRESLANNAPRQRPLRGDALSHWIDFLQDEPQPHLVATLEQFEPKAWAREGIYRWHNGSATPYALVNTTGRQFDIPSIVANTYYGRVIHAEGDMDSGPERFQAGKLYLGTDEAAPTDGIISLLFRAPEDGLYDFSIELTNRVDADQPRDPFYYIVVQDKLKDQGRLSGYEASRTLAYKQIDLKADDAFEICASGGGVTFPQAVMQTDMVVTRGSQTWDAAREFHSPNPGSPIVSADNPLVGNVWEYGYRRMQSEITDDWATINPSLFRHLTIATEIGPDSHGGEQSGPDLNRWSTPAVGSLVTHGLALHPGPTTGVGVEWTSPIDGRIEVAGEVHDLQAIEDGVQWRLDYRPGETEFVVASGVVRGGARQTLSYSQTEQHPIEMLVHQGEILRLSIEPQENSVADTTEVKWTIRELDGPQREWNLVDDLIAAVARGSLSVDSVWRLVDRNPAKLPVATVTDQPSDEQRTAKLSESRRLDDPLNSFTDWLNRFGGLNTTLTSDTDGIQHAIQKIQVELDELEQGISANPDQRAATILASPVRRLYIELTAEAGPFRFSERNDKRLLPAAALAKVQQLLLEQNELKNEVTLRYPVTMGTREGGARMTKYKGFNDVCIHEGGHYAHLGEVVPRGFPKVLVGNHTKPIPKDTSGRKQLAEWIADVKNPLPARVIVNRIWLNHFGQGLVRTPGNFGLLGEPPTHPRLLDYLAQQFIDSGWSFKKMHQQILLSATYRQSTTVSPEQLAEDPSNRLWSRMSVQRLPAEAIRDTLLAVSHQLDQRMGGPVVRKQEPDADAMMTRRALYLMTNRSDKSGFRFLFDAADPENVVDQRNVSTVAPQSLFLLNHPFVMQLLPSMAAVASQGLTPNSTDQEFSTSIQQLYERLYARPATPLELELGIGMLRNHWSHTSGDQRQDAFVEAWQQYCQVLLCTNELIYLN